MYVLVHVESRFLGAFLLLFWLGAYGALSLQTKRVSAAIIGAVVLLTVMIPFVADLALLSFDGTKDLLNPRTPGYQIAALGLRNLGLRDGDSLAIVGSAFDCYYARYDRLRVIAQIPDAREFSHLNALELKSLADKLSSIGVKALIVANRPGEWKDVKISESNRLDVLLIPPRASNGR